MTKAVLRRNPHTMTAYLASGGALDGSEATWLKEILARLRKLEPGASESAGGISLLELKQIYMTARVIQGSVVAGRLALRTTIEAGKIVRSTTSMEAFAKVGERATVETESFLTGSDRGIPRSGNDYPEIMKTYIATLAVLLEEPYGQAFAALERDHPELVMLGQSADEVQRLAWGHMRWLIKDSVNEDELILYRQNLREGTEELLAVLKERTGVSLPPRIMQRDDWREALEQPRQDPKLALFNSMKFFVTNAEVGLAYAVGTMLMRLKLGSSPTQALQDHIKFGAQEIAAGARTFTHKARFQSRVGARPNDYRSFEQFLSNVGKRAAGASIDNDGRIVWAESDALRERGYCPAQNGYEPGDLDELTDLAEEGRAEFEQWKTYGNATFGVEPVVGRPAPAELLGNVVVFMTMHEGSPLLPTSSFMSGLVDQL